MDKCQGRTAETHSSAAALSQILLKASDEARELTKWSQPFQADMQEMKQSLKGCQAFCSHTDYITLFFMKIQVGRKQHFVQENIMICLRLHC